MAEVPKRATARLTTSPATIYTAPSGGGTWVTLRNIRALCTTADDIRIVTIGVGANNTDTGDETSMQKRVISGRTVVQGEPLDEAVMIPLAPSEVIYGFADQAARVTVILGVTEGP